jgi:hypothetical protein
MSDSSCDFCGRIRHADLALEGRITVSLTLLAPALHAFPSHLLKFGDHRHKASLAIFRSRFRSRANVQLTAAEVHVSPRDILRLADPDAAVSKEAHKVSAVPSIA